MKASRDIKVAEEWWKKNSKDLFSKYAQRYKGVKFKIKYPVLDIGGGNGAFLKFLGVKKAVIVDIAGKESLVDKNYKFVRADITKKLPIKGKFKTIFIMETLEHIENPLYLLAQVYDLLHDKGTCYISIPYTKLDPNRKNKKNKYNCHVCRWKEKEILDQLSKLGFIAKVIQKRRRFKNLAFFLPHCWLVLEIKKRIR